MLVKISCKVKACSERSLQIHVGMAKLASALVLGACAEKHVGSNPTTHSTILESGEIG